MKRETVSGLGRGAWCGRYVRKGYVCGVVNEVRTGSGVRVRTVGRGVKGGWTYENVWVEGAGLAKVRVGDLVYGEGEWRGVEDGRWLELKGGAIVWRSARTWDEVD